MQSQTTKGNMPKLESERRSVKRAEFKEINV